MLVRLVLGSIKLTLLLGLIAGLAVGVPALLGVSAPSEPIDADDVEREMLEDINEQRASQGVGAVVESPAASQLASEHSKTMAETETLAHDAGGSTSDARLTAIGCEAGSENILRTQIDGGVRIDGGTEYATTAGETAEISMGLFEISDSHWTNINDPRWRSVGVGVTISDGDVWVTQVFCAG